MHNAWIILETLFYACNVPDQYFHASNINSLSCMTYVYWSPNNIQAKPQQRSAVQ
jgi:hypothetical protein